MYIKNPYDPNVDFSGVEYPCKVLVKWTAWTLTTCGENKLYELLTSERAEVVLYNANTMPLIHTTTPYYKSDVRKGIHDLRRGDKCLWRQLDTNAWAIGTYTETLWDTHFPIYDVDCFDKVCRSVSQCILLCPETMHLAGCTAPMPYPAVIHESPEDEPLPEYFVPIPGADGLGVTIKVVPTDTFDVKDMYTMTIPSNWEELIGKYVPEEYTPLVDRYLKLLEKYRRRHD